jgi:hypothetical protein
MSTQFAKTRPALTPEKLAGLDVALAKEIFSQGEEEVVFALLELFNTIALWFGPTAACDGVRIYSQFSITL